MSLGLKSLSHEETKNAHITYSCLQKSQREHDRCIKILKGKYDTAVAPNLERSEDTTRRHELKLYKRSKTAHRHHYFTQRIVDAWNSFPNWVVGVPNVLTFERRLDSYWDNQDKEQSQGGSHNYQKD